MRRFGETFRASIKGLDSSQQLASGLALGVLAGIIPKDSLIAWGVMTIALLSRANLLTFGCGFLTCSLLTGILASLFHTTGHWVLTHSYFQRLGAFLAEIPMVSWTQFDNTVVMGSILLGLAAMYPVYRVGIRFFDAYAESIFFACRNNFLIRWLVGPPKVNSSDVADIHSYPSLSEG